MTEKLASRITGRVVVGGLLIFFGLIFTLDNAGVLDAGDIFDYWPMILVVLGLLKVLQPREEGQRPFGIALLGLGVFLQLQMLVFTSWRLSLFPTLLLGGGALLIWRSLGRNRDRAPAHLSDGMSDFAFMGGVNRVVESRDFRGGEATAVMGAVELDLRGSTIATSPAIIDVFALWGGIEIKVPPEWKVDVRGIPILGGFENKARSSVQDATAPEQLLVIRGTALMGGVEIKN
ncbi:MAG: cell wall-active antibiotics response protein [Acidobacteriota bacterium]|nr:cell wall-active antibiotics response protein [Acidobacteriota bacterium]